MGTAVADTETSQAAATSAEPGDRADRVAARLALPVLIAALASVPAVFLTLLEAPYATIGSSLNAVSGAVLTAETVVLFVVAERRLDWLRRNWVLVATTAVVIPAVIFAVGPAQLLRLARVGHLLRLVGAFRIVRVGRILKAGRLLRERAGLNRRWQQVLTFVAAALAAAFVAVILADPTSASGSLLRNVSGFVSVPLTIFAALILAAATFTTVYLRRSRPSDLASSDPAAGNDAR